MINRYKITFLIIFTVLSLLVIAALPAIPQDLSYHQFADQRAYLGVPHGLNVLSNLGFLLVGLLGLRQLFWVRLTPVFIEPAERWPYFGIFIGAILVSMGSAYYHLHPDNATLEWDRLPMPIIMMSFFAMMLMERINRDLGLSLLLPLVLIGVGTSIYWGVSETLHHGDVRLYAWGQFYPSIMIVLLLFLFRSPYTGQRYLIEALVWFIIAKLSEALDHQIFALTHYFISGHTIKHLTAALAIYAVVRYLKYRKVNPC